MKRAARIAGRLALGLLAGTVLAAIIGLGLDVLAYLAGFDTLDPATSQTIGVVSGLIGWSLGVWLVFHYWKVEPRPAKRTVPPEQWGKRP